MKPSRAVAIHLNDVYKCFTVGRRRTQVLNGINVRLCDRELTAIVGPSGSGKTTLLRVIGGWSKPDSGTVSFNGRSDIYAQTDNALSLHRNRSIGFVFQNYRLLSHYNAIENVMLPLKVAGLSRRHQSALANRALDVVGLRAYKRRRVDQLSGGQAQRVSIARALAMRPMVLIADEPTGNLDSAQSAEIMDLFQRLRTQQGVSIVMVTHDRDLASQADHLITIADGRVRQDSYAAE